MPLPVPFANILYNFLLIFLTPFALCRLLYKSRLNAAYRHHICERFGYRLAPRNSIRPLWIHTVSVGEFLTLRPLLTDLLIQYPDIQLWLTCTTPTARAQIKQFQQKHPNRIKYSYIPYDIRCNNSRAFKHIQPCAIVLMETEIWPNLIQQATKRNIPVLLINARLSARSLRRYTRFGFARSLIRPVMQHIYVNAQTRFDARRLYILGTPKSHLTVTPNLKYQKSKIETIPADILALKNPAYTWIAASTHQGEEKTILAAHQILQQSLPDARLIIAPRHPERRHELSALIAKTGYTPHLRSYQQNPQTSADIYIVDTLGELAYFYHITDAAFIGGSLIPRGGHNPLEALHHGNAVIFGKSMYNFQSIRDELSSYPFAKQLNDNHPETLAIALAAFKQHDYRAAINSYTAAHADIAKAHATFIVRHAFPERRKNNE